MKRSLKIISSVLFATIAIVVVLVIISQLGNSGTTVNKNPNNTNNPTIILPSGNETIDTKTPQATDFEEQLSIISQPQSATVNDINKSLTASITCSGGAVPYSYKWEKKVNDSWQNQNNNNTSSFSSINDSSGSYTYRCTVTDANGTSVTSAEFVFEWSNPLKITSQPQSAAADELSKSLTASIMCSGGVAPYTYKWEKKANSKWQDQNNNTSSFASINDSSGSYTYRCTVTDANGTSVTSAEFIFAWMESLKIESLPQSATAEVNKNLTATITCSGGVTPYTYKWEKKVNNSWYDQNKNANSFTVTSSSSGSYIYRCTVTDTKGASVTSIEFIFTWLEQLRITSQPQSDTAEINQNLNTSIVCSGGTTPYVYKWEKKVNENWQDQNKKTSNFTVSNSDQGTYIYRCVVTDANGTSVTSIEFTFTWLEQLMITSQPQSASTEANKNLTATIKCSGGTIPYAYKWEKKADGSWQNQNTNTSSFTVSNSDQGINIYRCVVTDAKGTSVTSTEFTFTWLERFRITELPNSATSDKNKIISATITCQGGATPYTYKWEKKVNDSWQDQNKNSDRFSDYSNTPGSYTYRCVVTDANGTSVTSKEFIFTWLDTLIITSQPQSAIGETNTNLTATITCSGGKLPYTYKWEKLVYSNWAVQKSGPNSFSDISSVHLTSCIYRCTVVDANNVSVTSSEFEFKWYLPLKITKQPVSSLNEVNKNVSAQIECYGGVTPYSYKWENKEDGIWRALVFGGNSSTYVTTKSTAGAYSYRCIVTDSIGNSVASNEITFQWVKPMRITVQPQSATGGYCDNLTASITCSDGVGIYYYRWERKETGKWVTKGNGSSSFTTTNTEAGTFTYRCVVTDPSGNFIISNEFTFTWIRLPSIIGQPQSVAVKAGQTATLTYSVSIAPNDPYTYTYQWLLVESVNASGASFRYLVDDNYYSGTRTQTLKAKLTFPKAYMYMCRIVRSDGTVFLESNMATITVSN